MGDGILEQPWLAWGVALALAFPFLVLALGEAIHRLERRGMALAGTLATVRNLVVPLLAVLLLLRHVLGLAADDRTYRLAATALWIAVLHAVLSLLNVAFFAGAETSSWRGRMPALLRNLTRLFLVLVGAALVLSSVWGTDLGGLLTALGVGSIVLGLALQDTLGNVFAGIAMLVERPFEVGDWVQIRELVGHVIEINWRSVRIQNRQRDMFVVPNLVLGHEILRNFSRPRHLHVEYVMVSFSYDDPPNRVKRVLKQAALSTRWVLPEPAPKVRAVSFNDFNIQYKVELAVADYLHVSDVRDEFTALVWYAAKRNGLRFAFPIRTVYNVDTTPAAERELGELTERLRTLPALLGVERDTLADVAQKTGLQHYGQGEPVIREGARVEAVYFILEGRARVTRTGAEGREHEVNRLERGDFFGETAIFRREASSVTVTAVEDLEVVALKPDTLHAMLQATPRLARELSETMASRRQLDRPPTAG